MYCMSIRNIRKGHINNFSLPIMMRTVGTEQNMKNMVLPRKPLLYSLVHGRECLWFTAGKNYPTIKD